MESQKSDIRVKLVLRGSKNTSHCAWGKQCPGNEARWGRCVFVSNPFDRDYDWLVTRDDIPHILPGHKEILACPRRNTILFTSEPSSVTRYGKAFTAQFGYILTSQEEWALPHQNAIRSQAGNIWHYGRSYDDVKAAPVPKKTELFSTFCSAKQMAYTMHAKRFEFTQRLKAAIPELEIFGKGVRFIEKKSDAIDPYKFHLTIENHAGPHHWTEKLADAFLGYCVPIYCGCTNIFDYFPEDSLVQIDIKDFEGSLAMIQRTLSTEGEYERRLGAVKEARRRVIEEYNLPAMLSHIIEHAEPLPDDAEKGVIYNRRFMRVRRPDEFVRFASWRITNFLRDMKYQIRSVLKPQ